MALVSIIVPVYNVISYLPKTVQSLMHQTESDIEIILVDDGSTDGCSDLCDHYAQADSRISVIHKQNGGLSSARNAGLDAAAGRYVLFVDGDDFLAENAVALLLAALEEQSTPEQIDYVQFRYTEVSENETPTFCGDLHSELVTDTREMFERLYRMGGVAASSCTKLFRRKIFDSYRFREELRHEDEQLMTDFLPHCRAILYTDLVLYAYVMRSGSIIRSGFTPSSMDVLPVLDERIAVLQRLGYSDLVKETQRRQFQTAALQYCNARRDGFVKESKLLKQKIIALSKVDRLTLSGQFKILYLLSQRSKNAPNLYYLTRLLLRK